MDNLIFGFTMEDYARRTAGLIFEVRNLVTAVVGFGEAAREQLDPSHPAFADFAKALQAAERARVVIEQFDREVWRRKQETEMAKGRRP